MTREEARLWLSGRFAPAYDALCETQEAKEQLLEADTDDLLELLAASRSAGFEGGVKAAAESAHWASWDFGG